MKRLVVLLAAALVFLCACGGGYTQYEYVKAAEEVDVFSCFDEFGAVVKEAEFSIDGELSLAVEFQSASLAQQAVEAINKRALDEKRYAEKKRVMEIKQQSGSIATIYVKHVSHLRTQDINFMPKEYFDEKYFEQYKTTEFLTVKGNAYDLKKEETSAYVLILNNVPPVKIKLGGSISASTALGRTEVQNDSVFYSSSDVVIVFKSKYSVFAIVAIIAGSLLAAALVIGFVVAVRCGLFTKLKIKKAKDVE